MNINIDPRTTMEAAEAIISAVDSYMTEVGKVYSDIDDLKDSWAGDKAEEFITKINNVRGEFEGFGKELKMFGDKLKEIGNDYQKLEQI